MDVGPVELINFSYQCFQYVYITHLVSCSIKNTYDSRVTTLTPFCCKSSLHVFFKYGQYSFLHYYNHSWQNCWTRDYCFCQVFFTVYICIPQNYQSGSCRICQLCYAGPDRVDLAVEQPRYMYMYVVSKLFTFIWFVFHGAAPISYVQVAILNLSPCLTKKCYCTS